MTLSLRPYEDHDEQGVLALLATSLGKVADERYAAFFRWKHLENPFGRSFMWVAESDGAVVGFRAFLRWRFVAGGDRVEAVRAVDTATDPAHRGGGVFRRLTLHGLEALREAGIRFVFNTPNDQSRPGYLKMGWQVVGRVPVQITVRSLPGMARLVRARGAAASPWSLPDDRGPLVQGMWEDDVLAAARGGRGMSTDWDRATLGWRAGGFAPTSYRLLGDPRSGPPIVYRCRERGGAVECTIGMARDPALPARALRAAGADYAVGTLAPGRWRGLARAQAGPTLTYRAVADDREAPPLEDWRLDLLDLELF